MAFEGDNDIMCMCHLGIRLKVSLWGDSKNLKIYLREARWENKCVIQMGVLLTCLLLK